MLRAVPAHNQNAEVAINNGVFWLQVHAYSGCLVALYLRRNILTRTLPEHMRAGSLPVDQLRQQLRHRAAAARPATALVTGVATGVATGVGAAGRERLQQPPQQQEAGGPQEEEGHEAPSR